MSIFNIPTNPRANIPEPTIVRSQLKRNFMYEHRRTGLSDAENRELNKKAYGISKMLKEQSERAQAEYELEHKNGYCPKCFSLIRLNGLCDNCD